MTAAPAGEADPDVLRATLVDRLLSKGVLRSAAVAGAFAAVPRHLFVPGVPVEEAYRDTFIPTKRLADGEVVSSSSQPEIMAVMLEQLDVRRGHRILEVGAGTGYNAALLAHLAGEVTSLDIDEDLVAAAREHLAAAGVTGVRVVCADGWAGHPEGAPYDRIILTVGAHDVSPAWRAQLAPGGRLVLPLQLPAVQATVAFQERDGILESISVRGCAFMRLRGTAAQPMRGVALGPEPAPQVWPRPPHAVDGPTVYALLGGPRTEWPTGLVLPARRLYDAVVPWLALHEPTSAWLTAQGKAVETGLVPPLFEGGSELASTFGLFEPGGVALLVSRATLQGPGGPNVVLGLRAHGDSEVGARLRGALRAWDGAGRPDLTHLRVRAVPVDHPHRPMPGEFVVARACTRLLLHWHRGMSLDADPVD